MSCSVIFGAGGHAKSVISSIGDPLKTSALKIVLDYEYLSGERKFFGHDVYDFEQLNLGEKFCFHIAIGENYLREIIFQRFKSRFFNASPMDPIVHPSAVVSHSASLGPGSFIGPCAYVGPDANIGVGCVVNTSSVVEHDCKLDDFSFLAPKAVLAGKVVLGRRSYVGLGSVVVENTTIDEDVVVGCGSTVLSSFKSSVLVYGSPARIIRPRSKSDLIFK